MNLSSETFLTEPLIMKLHFLDEFDTQYIHQAT